MQRNATLRFGQLAWRGLASAAALALFVAPAQAQTASTATMDVSVTITAAAPTCSFTVPAVDFGSVANDSPSAVRSYDVSFDCTGTVAAATLSFDGGQNPVGSGTLYLRRMSNGPDGVRYSIRDATDGLSYDVDQPITFALPAGPSSRSLSSAIPGIDFSGKPLGTYTDQVVATFTF